ncbi:polysaccharide biosynthesis tyrosine autokinase [Fibrobacter sp. UWH4]|uniref:polysaccharide biosynthesis tyrosine autokinase n=1 Tax=Fibrobacter sp. UWH4 TaxID=1896210 RepID=UPI000916225B|nr:polysaccharide biosynthesis tyrosine autokinase [Fibrobacter sp. UWH4]SHK66593.1 tyrosine-protein kinase Etk/Wzc [Fibrobacter sp. UWH4]
MTVTPNNNQPNTQLPFFMPIKAGDSFDLFSNVLHHWKLVAFLSIVGLMAGTVFSRYVRDSFDNKTMLQLDTKSKSGKAVSDIGDLFDVQSPAVAEIHLIKSLSVLMPVVEQLRLNYMAEPQGVVDRLMRREGRMDLELFEPPRMDEELVKKGKKWIAVIQSEDSYELFSPMGQSLVVGKVGETYRIPMDADTVAICVKAINAEPGQSFSLSRASVLSVAEGLQASINAYEKEKNSNILEISYSDRYPDRVAEVLNAIAQTYVRQNVEMRSAEAEKSLDFLEEQLPSIKAKLDSSERLLTNYRNKMGTVDLGAEAKGTLERQVELKTQLLSLQQQYHEKARLFKEDHPAMQAILQQQQRLSHEIGKEESKTKKLPITQQDVLKLQQDVEINNQLYTSVLNNIQQLRVVRASEIGNVRIVDPAYIHVKPSKPNRKKIMAAGFGGGFALSLVLIYLLHTLSNRGVGSSSEIERETGVSVYAKIPKTQISHKLPGASDKRFILAKADSEDLAVEKIRALRTALEFSFLDEGGKVLMVTGIAPGAGKSFVSLNLAYLFAQQGKRSIFIDADLRKSRLSHKHEKGITDVIAKGCDLEKALIDIGDGAYFLPMGSRVANPGEMLGSKAFAELVQECKSKFDVVIIDTPPIALVSDALAIAKLADFGLIVIEYKKHSMENIQETIEQLNIAKLDKKAIVLNHCIHDSGAYGYGYGYGYGYRYRYRDK